jgi:hypothetical protein
MRRAGQRLTSFVSTSVSQTCGLTLWSLQVSMNDATIAQFSAPATELSQHEADRGPAQECERVTVQTFPVLGQSSAAVEPADGSLDDPTLGQNDESLGGVRSLDDFQIHLAHDALERGLELRSLIAAVGVKLEEKGLEAEQARHHENAAIAILNVGSVNDGVHQQALRIDKDVALFAFDFLARIVSASVDATPPFSALFTLWLSMIAAV